MTLIDRRSLAVVVTAAALFAGSACLDHDAAAPVGVGRARLSLSVSSSASAADERAVDVNVFYLRARTDERVPLFLQQFRVDAGTKQLPVTVDLAICLADPDRAGGTSGCSLTIDVVLRETGGIALDSQAVGPFEAAPGQTVSVPPLTLREAASLTIVSGDTQIGWVGLPLLQPVEIKIVDRNGAPVPNRTIAVTSVSGGGATEGTAVTDANGIARAGYRLGAAPGVNSFTVGATGVAARTISATGIRITRNTIAAGLSTCFIKPTGSTFCWGDNSAGQLGNPAVVGDTTLPVAVSGGLSFETMDINGSGNNSFQACALTRNGRAYCWGSNPRDELGVTSTGTCPGLSGGTHPCATSPQPLTGNFVFRTISVDANDVGQNGNAAARACGVTTDGTALCWGDGLAGELGTGANASTSVPAPIASPLKFVYVSTMGRSACGLATTGEVRCWGQNSQGTLGDGTTVSSNVPVRIASSQRFQYVEVGFQFACALAIDKQAYCWGRDWSSGLTPTNRLAPTLIPGGLQFELLSVGGFHACGIIATGEAYCWGGEGGEGVLGDGVRRQPSIGATSPVAVAGGLRFAEMSAGPIQTCGLTTAGDVYCWGSDFRGSLGIGSRNAVVNVPALVNFGGLVPGAPARLTALDVTSAPVQAIGSTALTRPTVRVTDANGIGVQGATVTFTVTAGGGQLVGSVTTTSSTAVTGPGGVAPLTQSVWVLGPIAGTQTVVASVTTPGVASVSFSIPTIRPGTATKLATPAPSFQVAAGAPIIGTRVVATDANGLVVTGVPVAFTVTPGLRIGASSQSTDRDGIASVSLIPGTTPRVDTVTVTAPGLTPVVIEVRTVPATPSTLRFTIQPSTAAPGARIAPAVAVEMLDRFGNRVDIATSARQITLSLTGGNAGAKLGGTLAVATVNGTATFSDLAVDLTGTNYQLRASTVVPTGTISALSGPFAVVGAGVRSVSVTPPNAILKIGDAITAVANVDADPGVSRAVTWSSSNTAVATVDATGRITALSVGTAIITAASVINPTITGSVALTVRAPQPATISIQSIVATATGVPVNVNNVIGSINVTVNVAPGDDVILRVAVLIDGVEVGSAPTGGTFTINTATVIPATGKLQFCNGSRQLSARVYTVGGPVAGTASAQTNLNFNNNGSC